MQPTKEPYHETGAQLTRPADLREALGNARYKATNEAIANALEKRPDIKGFQTRHDRSEVQSLAKALAEQLKRPRSGGMDGDFTAWVQNIIVNSLKNNRRNRKNRKNRQGTQLDQQARVKRTIDGCEDISTATCYRDIPIYIGRDGDNGDEHTQAIYVDGVFDEYLAAVRDNIIGLLEKRLGFRPGYDQALWHTGCSKNEGQKALLASPRDAREIVRKATERHYVGRSRIYVTFAPTGSETSDDSEV